MICVMALVLCVVMPGIVSAESGITDEIFSILEDHKREPSTFEDYDKLATIAYTRGNYEEAIGYLDQCLAFAEDNVMLAGSIWTQKGMIYEKMTRFDDAMNALNKAAEFNPRNPQMLMLRGKIYLELKEYGLATVELLEYTRLLPEDSEGWMYLASAQRRNDQKEKGDESAAKGTALGENTANAILTAARTAGLQGDLQTAELGYTQFLEASEDEAGKVRFLRATARMQLGLLDGAIDDLQTAIQDGYEDIGVCYEYLSSCQFALNEYEKVIEAGEKSVSIGSDKPAYDTMYQRMGISAIALGDMEAAEEYFSKSMAQNDDLIGNYYYRALSRMGGEKYTEAVEDFTVSIDREEVVQRSLYNRGLCLIQANNINTAIADLRGALEMNDDTDVTLAAEEILWQLALQYMDVKAQ